MAHTDAHAPFSTTEYAKRRNTTAGYDIPDSLWYEAVKHFPRDTSQSFTVKKENRKFRRRDNMNLSRIKLDPDFADEAVFESSTRRNVLAWS